jgi:hypothetical protein
MKMEQPQVELVRLTLVTRCMKAGDTLKPAYFAIADCFFPERLPGGKVVEKYLSAEKLYGAIIGVLVFPLRLPGGSVD